MVGNPLKPTAGLENLLNLDGEIFPMETSLKQGGCLFPSKCRTGYVIH